MASVYVQEQNTKITIEDELNEPLLNNNKYSDTDDNEDFAVLPDEEIDKVNCCTYKDIFTYVTIFLIWVSFYWLFINWGFGSVYFIITALVGMYFNTSTKKKRKGEISAYSVFNKNCESIKGTVKAEDLERQMIYGQLF